MKHSFRIALIVLALAGSSALAQVPGGGGGGPGNGPPPGQGGQGQGGPGQGGPGQGSAAALVDAAKREVDEATKALRTAKTDLVKAQKAVTDTLRKIEAEVDKKDDVIAAAATVATTKKAYDDAAAPVLAALSTHPDYTAAIQKAADAQAHIDALNANATVSIDDRMVAVKAAAAAREAVAKLRNDALAANPAVATTRDAFTKAGQDLAKLRAQYLNLKDNEDYKSAKQAVEEAKTKVSQLDDDLKDAQKKLAEAKSEAAAQKNNNNGNGGRGPGGR